MQRIAAPMVGGMITAPLLSMFGSGGILVNAPTWTLRPAWALRGELAQ